MDGNVVKPFSVKNKLKKLINYGSTLAIVAALLVSLICIVGTLNFDHADGKTLRRFRRFYEDMEDEFNQVIKVGMEAGRITSPEYPDIYPSKMNCSWLLIAPTGETLRLVLSEVIVEESVGCLYDYIELFDGPTRSSPSLGRYCGRAVDVPLASTSNEVLVVFVSDDNYEEKGFKLDYLLLSDNNCNGTIFVDEEGMISSPNYPSNYPDDVDCWTHLQTDEDSQILFSFSAMDLEISSDCEFDYVHVYDGDNPGSLLLDSFCQEPPVFRMMSSGPHLLVHFHSDNLLNSKGFVLTYSVFTGFVPQKNEEYGECSWDMDILNGTITSPNYPKPYENNQYCEFLLVAPAGQRLKLTIDRIDMEPDLDCEYDYLEARDGNSEDATLLGKFCGHTKAGTWVMSTYDTMYVKFESNDNLVFSGFTAHYTVVAGSRKYGDDSEEDGSTSEECNDIICNDVAEPIVVNARPQNISLGEGATHTLSCSSANKNDVIVWFKDLYYLYGGEETIAGVMKLANNSLVISDMNWKLEGIYTCIILSGKGSESISAWVSLMKSPAEDKNACDIKFDNVPGNTALLEGNFAFVRCSAVNADVEWTKNGTPVSTLNHPRIHIILPGLMLFHRAKPEDSGRFTCVATHRAKGCKSTKDAVVFVSTKPARSCGITVFNEPKTSKPSDAKGRIVGGQTAIRGSIPWQAMLWETKAESFCGGSLISHEWVVTAAHCIALFPTNQNNRELDYKNLFVRLGKHDRTKHEREEERIGVDNIILHHGYKHNTYDNDIALIHLQRPVKYSDYILPLCLGEPRYLATKVYDKAVMGTVSGWGQLTYQGAYPKELQEIRLPMVDNRTCRASTTHTVTDNMFCAGFSQSTSRDACKGDSGGPFAVKVDHNWYLVGIVSWGEECGRAGKYGFYTKVGNYYQWMLDTIQAHSLYR